MLKIVQVDGKGQGTIATQHIKQGSLIEASPVFTLPLDQRNLLKEAVLSEYYFIQPSEYHSNKDQASGHIFFGLSSFCNHSVRPNAKIEWVDRNDGLWAHLIAVRDIQIDEEVTLFYTNLDEYLSADLFTEAR
ncbi:MAG: SET domain-containing protein [Leptolyngbya sp. SIO1D8]|nr:SET domain-containing protein [Leptolyngbya sp. SIO1D8]